MSTRIDIRRWGAPASERELAIDCMHVPLVAVIVVGFDDGVAQARGEVCADCALAIAAKLAEIGG